MAKAKRTSKTTSSGKSPRKSSSSKQPKAVVSATGNASRTKKRKSVKQEGKQSPKKRSGSDKQIISSCFGHLQVPMSSESFSCVVGMATGGEDGWIYQLSRLGFAESAGRGGKARASKGPASLGKKRQLARLVQALASPHRVTLLAKLLEGPATYRALEKATGLKVGPLYHHIGQLRQASLIAPKERDLYRLTKAGRNLFAVLLTALPMLKDTRPLQ